MIKSIYFFWLVFAVAILSSSVCNANDKKNIFAAGVVCEFNIGGSEAVIPRSFNKITFYNEVGESFVYRGRICSGKVLVDISVSNKMIDKISIIDLNFCNGAICIGSLFKDVKGHLNNSKLYFSGEEGGVFSLEVSSGISYLFSKDGIDISCYINMERCEQKINNAKLTSILISDIND